MPYIEFVNFNSVSNITDIAVDALILRCPVLQGLSMDNTSSITEKRREEIKVTYPYKKLRNYDVDMEL